MPSDTPIPGLTVEDAARMDFEPCLFEGGAWTPPSNEEWCAVAAKLRAASLVMQRDKPDLIRMCDEIGGHVMLDTMESIGGTAKFLEAAAAIARSAANRMLVAAAASVEAADQDADAEVAAHSMDVAKTAPPQNVRFAAVVVPVRGYDFPAGVMQVGAADAPTQIPMDNLISFHSDHMPGTRVLVDDAMSGILLLSTEHWSLVTPWGRSTPVVVETSRVSHMPGEHKLVA